MTERAEQHQGSADDFAAAYPGLFLQAMRLAYRITGSRETAEDVAAEALARTYSRWGAVRGLSYRDAWVMRVATNIALDAVRRRRPADHARRLLQSAHRVDATYGGVEDAVATRLALVAALQQLATRQRDAIALHYLAGLNESEVSASLGISASAVRTHVQRGLARLRSHLGDAPEEVLRGR